MQGFDLPLGHGAPAKLELLGRRRGPPGQVGDLVLRPQLQFGVAMALETEGHAEGLGVINLVHLVDPAVAFDATDAPVDVDGVVEIDEVGQLVDLDPGNGLAALGALAHQLQTRIILEHLVVAVHAGGTGRDVREPGFLDAGMAVTAIDPELARVGGVRKSDGLNGLIAHTRVFRSEIVPDTGRDGAPGEKKPGDDHRRQAVGPLWENR